MGKQHVWQMINGVVLAALLGMVSVAAADGTFQYEVTITNLTRGQSFTPILVASHEGDVRLFTPGAPASPELAILAEGGDTGPLAMLLADMPGVNDIAVSEGLLAPGDSVTVTVMASGRFDHLSAAAMLIPTNDGFLALNGVKGPKGHKTRMLFSPAYDAGSEPNDETCAAIPGPVCGGEGVSEGGGEGYVHIHAGMHGIGDLDASERDWRNPVARITIRQLRNGR